MNFIYIYIYIIISSEHFVNILNSEYMKIIPKFASHGPLSGEHVYYAIYVFDIYRLLVVSVMTGNIVIYINSKLLKSDLLIRWKFSGINLEGKLHCYFNDSDPSGGGVPKVYFRNSQFQLSHYVFFDLLTKTLTIIETPLLLGSRSWRGERGEVNLP